MPSIFYSYSRFLDSFKSKNIFYVLKNLNSLDIDNRHPIYIYYYLKFSAIRTYALIEAPSFFSV